MIHATRNNKLTAVIPRLVFCVAFACFSLVACMPSGVKKGSKTLPPEALGYFGYSLKFDHFPDWYRLYSLLPGDLTKCHSPEKYSIPAPPRKLTIANCSRIDAARLASLAASLQAGINSVEKRFGGEFHVSEADYYLVNEIDGYLLRHTQLLRRNAITFKIAIRSDQKAPTNAERLAVRTTAHELLHIAWIVTGREDKPAYKPGADEEVRASIFESCIEKDVFGNVSELGLSEDRQIDPQQVSDISFAHHSALGSVEALKEIRAIAGSDLRIDGSDEERQLDKLCRGMVAISYSPFRYIESTSSE